MLKEKILKQEKAEKKSLSHLKWGCKHWKHSVKVKKEKDLLALRKHLVKKIARSQKHWDRYLKLLTWEERENKILRWQNLSQKAKVWNTSSLTTISKRTWNQLEMRWHYSNNKFNKSLCSWQN